MRCPICSGKTTLVKGQVNDVEFRKDSFRIYDTYYLCDNCGEKIVDSEMGNLSTIQLYNQYREKYNLMFPTEITALRETYGLSKIKMSIALGWGENTYANYEKGALPNESHNFALRFIEDPEHFLKHVKTRLDIFSQNELEELEKKIHELEDKNGQLDWIDLVWPHKIKRDTGFVKPNLDKFINMVLYFLNSDRLYKTKLNKLLFYADFYHYKTYSVGISGSRYRAIEFGPVPSEYDAIYNWLYKKNYIIVNEALEEWGATETFAINEKINDNIFMDNEKESLRLVSEKFKDYTTSKLKDFSHQERGWIDNKNGRKIISYQDYAFDLSI